MVKGPCPRVLEEIQQSEERVLEVLMLQLVEERIF